MRDSKEEMIELLNVSREDQTHSVDLGLVLDDQAVQVRIGIEPSDFQHLRRILEFRPFLDTAAGPYSYFFTHS